MNIVTTGNFLLSLVIILSVFLACAIVVFGYSIYTMNKHKSNMENLTRYNINVAANIDRSIPGVLEYLIQDCFNDYKVKNLAYKIEEYITPEREAEIRKDLVEVVTKRLSRATLDKLSLFYNIDSIATILADKIYIIVMDYVVDHNSKLNNMQSPKNK